MKPIFSNDPHALEKLKLKLEKLEALQKYMKDINAGYRKYGLEWVKNTVSLEQYKYYLGETKYSWNKGKFYPRWALSNNSAVIRNTKKRIAELSQ